MGAKLEQVCQERRQQPADDPDDGEPFAAGDTVVRVGSHWGRPFLEGLFEETIADAVGSRTRAAVGPPSETAHNQVLSEVQISGVAFIASHSPNSRASSPSAAKAGSVMSRYVCPVASTPGHNSSQTTRTPESTSIVIG